MTDAETSDRYALSFTTGTLLTREAALLAPAYLKERDWEKARDRAVADNLLQARTHRSGVRLVRETVKRLSALTEPELELLGDLTATERGHLMWVAACRRYSLIAEFAEVPVRFAGRVFAGLGEVVRVLLVERDDLEHTRDRVAQIAHAQSYLGLLVHDQVATTGFYDEPSVQMPPALLLRVARILETAADLVEDGLIGYQVDPEESAGLPSALRRDVRLMRTMAGQESSA